MERSSRKSRRNGLTSGAAESSKAGLPEFSVTNLSAVRGLAPISTPNNTEKKGSQPSQAIFWSLVRSSAGARNMPGRRRSIGSKSRRFAMHSLRTGTLSHVRIIEHCLRVDVRYPPRSGFFVTKVGLSRVQVL
jgi:hypothetical protein